MFNLSKSVKVTLTKVKNYIHEVLGSNPGKRQKRVKRKKSQIMGSNAIFSA